MSLGDRMSEPHDCAGDAAAYVLGALEPSELPTFLAHLEQCTICREEVDSLTGVVQALPMAAVQYKVPRHLRRQVMRGVRQSSPELYHSHQYGWRSIGARVAQTLDGFRLAGNRAIAGIGAGAVTVAGAVVAVIAISAGPGATIIQAKVTGIQGTAQLRLNNGGHAELVVRHMTSPGKGHIYEVWLKSGAAAPVPASVLFSVSSSGNADVSLPDRIKGTESVLVTPEPLGGSPAPTHTPVVSATATVD
jgi:hypothetical protein